jgi:hypothetical protein
VIHGVAISYRDDESTEDESYEDDAVAGGVADDPDSDTTWRLVVAHHPTAEGDLDAVTSALEGLAGEFAGRNEVVEVAPHGEVATATIRVGDPNIWRELQIRFDALFTGLSSDDEPSS